MNLNNSKTTQHIMQALRDEYPRDPLLDRLPNGRSQEIADRVNTTWKVDTTSNYVKSCVSARRRLASPAGQLLLSVYKSTGDWKKAWDDTMTKYPKGLGPSKINDYKTMAIADPVFRSGPAG